MNKTRLEEKRKQIRIKKGYNEAQRDINIFTSIVMRDSKTGQPFLQAEHHKLMQNHIDWCIKNKKYAGIMSFWGSGKSSQVISRILFMLGNNPNLRIKIVCNLDEYATKRVNAVREYMEKSEQYRKIFPNVFPDQKDKWGERRINVKRTIYGSADYSLEGGGIFSSAVSGRADVLVVDDIVDFKNSVLNVASRKHVIESLTNNWISRLEPEGNIIFIGTPWHINDCSFFLINNNVRFNWIIMQISDDFEKLEVIRRWWE